MSILKADVFGDMGTKGNIENCNYPMTKRMVLETISDNYDFSDAPLDVVPMFEFRSLKEWRKGKTGESEIGIHQLPENTTDVVDAVDMALKDLFPRVIFYVDSEEL